MLIIKTGAVIPGLETRYGDFEDWFIRGLGADGTYTVVAVYCDEPLPPVAGVKAVLITGSPAMVSHRAPWSERTAEWLREAFSAGLPMLGVCYGHQLLAHALGGRVGPNPNGRQIGTRRVSLLVEDDPLFAGMGGERCFQTTHVESVLKLPPGATRLAQTPLDPNHAFRIGNHAWGVQFHPEFDGDVMTAYLLARRPELEAEGFDVGALLAGVSPAPAGSEVLARFAAIADAAGSHSRRHAHNKNTAQGVFS